MQGVNYTLADMKSGQEALRRVFKVDGRLPAVFLAFLRVFHLRASDIHISEAFPVEVLIELSAPKRDISNDELRGSIAYEGLVVEGLRSMQYGDGVWT